MPEDLGAQVVDQALADPRGEVPLDHAEESVEDGQARDHGGDGDHHTGPFRDDAPVDDHGEQHRVQHGDHCVQRGRQQEDRQVQPVRPGIPGDPPDRARLQPLLGHRRIAGEAAHSVPLGLHGHDR